MKRSVSLLSILCLSAVLACRGQETASPAQPAGPGPEPDSATVQQTAPVRNQRRLMDSVKRLFSVEAVTSTLPAAGVEQLHDWPGEWGRHGSGFAKRVGSLYAQFIIGVAIEDSVKAIHHEDTH